MNMCGADDDCGGEREVDDTATSALVGSSSLPVSSPSSAAPLHRQVNWVLIEAMGRRGYTLLARAHLRLALQISGCKPHQCPSFAQNIFDELCATPSQCQRYRAELLIQDKQSVGQGLSLREQWARRLLSPMPMVSSAAAPLSGIPGRNVISSSTTPEIAPSTSPPPSSFSSLPILSVSSTSFHEVIDDLFQRELKGDFSTTDPRRRFAIASSIVERRQPLVVLCGGTSGCGKSTVASLVCSRIGINRLVSTDTVRELLRLQTDESQVPELFTSTYCGYEVSSLPKFDVGASGSSSANPVHVVPVGGGSPTAITPGAGGTAAVSVSGMTESQKILAVYDVQCSHILKVVDRMIDDAIHTNDTILIEGVHLHPQYMAEKAVSLAQAGVVCVPFLIHVKKEAKHKERLAVRGKSMTLDAKENKYVRHFTGIRTIQDALVARGQKLGLFLVNNTNVDRSLTRIHLFLLACLERWAAAPTTSLGGISGGSLGGGTSTSAGTPWLLTVGSDVRSLGTKEALRRIIARKEEKRKQRARSAGGGETSTSAAAAAGVLSSPASPPLLGNAVFPGGSSPLPVSAGGVPVAMAGSGGGGGSLGRRCLSPEDIRIKANASAAAAIAQTIPVSSGTVGTTAGTGTGTPIGSSSTGGGGGCAVPGATASTRRLRFDLRHSYVDPSCQSPRPIAGIGGTTVPSPCLPSSEPSTASGTGNVVALRGSTQRTGGSRISPAFAKSPTTRLSGSSGRTISSGTPPAASILVVPPAPAIDTATTEGNACTLCSAPSQPQRPVGRKKKFVPPEGGSGGGGTTTSNARRRNCPVAGFLSTDESGRDEASVVEESEEVSEIEGEQT